MTAQLPLQIYTSEFRAPAVLLVTRDGLSSNAGAVAGRRIVAEAEAGNSQLRRKDAELRRKNAELRMERDILK